MKIFLLYWKFIEIPNSNAVLRLAEELPCVLFDMRIVSIAFIYKQAHVTVLRQFFVFIFAYDQYRVDKTVHIDELNEAPV